MQAGVKLGLMDYTTSPGIKEAELSTWLATAAKKYGTFEDGRVNYTDSPIAPIVMCTLLWNDKMLLVKRGYNLADANGYWSTVNGFIDEPKSPAEFAVQEISEELDFKVQTKNVKVADSYTLKGMKERRTYIVFPCLVSLDKKPLINLNEENTDFNWISRNELENFNILADLPMAVDAALALV